MSHHTETSNPRRSIMTLGIAVEGGLMLVALLFGWLLGQPPLQTFRLDIKASLLGLVATLPMLLLFFVCLKWPVGPLKPIQQICEEVLVPLLSPCTILDMALISLLAGVGEEMLFRGVAQAALTSWFGNVVIGQLGASVLFGFCHAITAEYFVLATLLGVYLGGLWLYTGNLLAPIIAHGVYDFIVIFVLVRGRNGRAGSMRDGLSQPPSLTPPAPMDSDASHPNSNNTA